MKLNGNAKAKLNMSIDIVLFILLVAMAGIGFLMKFVVVSGEVRNVLYGNQIDLEFWGLSRHEWGSIHLIISIVFITMLILHTIFHWKFIVTIFQCMFPQKFIRYSITGILCLFGLITLVSPFFLEPEKVPFEPKFRNKTHQVSLPENIRQENRDNEDLNTRQYTESVKKDTPSEVEQKSIVIADENHHHSEYSEFEVYGYQTLQEAAERYNVPAEIIARDLNIPENLIGEKLGHLRKQYSFTMTDVRKSISDYKNQKL